jgi:hypothetical protein
MPGLRFVKALLERAFLAMANMDWECACCFWKRRLHDDWAMQQQQHPTLAAVQREERHTGVALEKDVHYQ